MQRSDGGRSERKKSTGSDWTKMTSLRRPDGTVTASRKAMEKVTLLLWSLRQPRLPTYLPTYCLKQEGYVTPSVLTSEIRYANRSMRNGTAPGLDRFRAEHLKNPASHYKNSDAVFHAAHGAMQSAHFVENQQDRVAV
uniref:Uncharacterized protein n=1 Tax=Haemonchus contortus TaxID=6289 RepID=A0A7I4YUJ9_HAECO